MTDKKSCMYAGQEYSHGATRCGGNEILECHNGEWLNTHHECKKDNQDITTGSVCIGSGVEFIRTDGELLQVNEISSEEDIPSANGLYRVNTVSCFTFTESGGNSHTKLIRVNRSSCESFMQCTVRWRTRDGDFIGDPVYRLQSGQSRFIKRYGWTGTIISEGPVDLMRGEDVLDRLSLHSKKIQGGDLWSIRNGTYRYVVFKIDVYKDSKVMGYAKGVVDPGDETNVFWFGPGEKGFCLPMIGRADPD